MFLDVRSMHKDIQCYLTDTVVDTVDNLAPIGCFILGKIPTFTDAKDHNTAKITYCTFTIKLSSSLGV